jgi:hypothetical protein
MAGKPASRQRKWQLKQREAGLCALCPKPVKKWGLCQDHSEKATSRRRLTKGVKRQYLPKSAWEKVDWSLPRQKIASNMGVSEATVRYHWKKVSAAGLFTCKGDYLARR